MGFRSAIAVVAAALVVPVVAASPAHAATPLNVYVGYMDTHTAASSSRQPSPWPYTDPSSFVGSPCSSFGTSTTCWDASAVRLDNPGGSNVTGVHVVVVIGSHTYDLWGSRTVKAGGRLVLTETGGQNSQNFDGSDEPPNAYNGGGPASCTNSGAIPVVRVTIAGTTTSYTDSGQVLNTGGVDAGHCVNGSYVASRRDESHPWAQIGTAAPQPPPPPPPAAKAPSAPRSLAAVAGDGSVKLSWAAPASDGGAAVTGYRVYRGTSSGGESGTHIATVTGRSFTDTGRTNGTRYFYQVAAVNRVGTSPRTDEVAATPQAAPAPPPKNPGVCAGVMGCRVMARADINGDGTPDAVGMVRHGGGPGAHGSVVVRVKTAPGHVVSVRRPLADWSGSPWTGVAALDGRPGLEVMVGRQGGAASQLHQSVTWRAGRLVLLAAPGPDRWWGVGQSATAGRGWLRRSTDPVGTVRERVAVRVSNHGAKPFRGTVTTYRWSAAGWNLVGRQVVRISSKTAASWPGFHIPGL